MGDNSEGALGAGTLTNAIEASGVTDISAGGEFSLFLSSSNLWGMGANDYGELGGGTTDDAFLPELILGPVPSLALATYSNQPVLLFPTLAGNNHVLQMTTNPASGVWVAVTNGVTFTGMQIPNAPGTAFFRLHSK